MSIQIAPTELLHEVFLHLPKSSLLQCALVCQSWYLPALQLFYEHVELSEKTKKVWLHRVQAPTAIPSIGMFVRKLTVNLAFSTTLSQVDFLKVISYLPFLKTVDLNASGYKLHYLSYLNKRDPGCVTYLEDIETGDLFTNYQIQQHFLCAYSFRHSLKKITLRHPANMYLIGGQNGTAVSFLGEFANLTHINIIDEVHLGETEMEVFMNSIQSCSKLVSLSYQNNCLFPYQQDNVVQSRIMRKSTRLSRLKTISLNVSYLTAIYMTQMLLLVSPNSLEKLTIYMTDADYRDWIQENYGLFISYFVCVKNLDISFTNASRRFSDQRPRIQSASKFGLFLQSLIGTRILDVHIAFIKSVGAKPNITIKKDPENIHILYNIGTMADFCICLEELSLVCSSNQIPITVDSLVAEILLNEKDDFDYGQCMEMIKFIRLLPYPPKSVCITSPAKTHLDEEGYVIELKSSSMNGATPLNTSILDDALFKNINLEALSTKGFSDILPHVKTLKLIHCKTENKRVAIDTEKINLDELSQFINVVFAKKIK
ncbi:uncharacterized protein EV154DRAFT_492942 [Mucor mucedo]|uniref:uncharacterized protein n=1 Tax=Mucor mucedo TaxID=29922 RepID=UPI0022210A6B|nr:uncharacterized protein EV154DRAFT_492942 [Mucor mucedo]KAI7896291.1 hypothetical protein EV154DRAFT_492942 [Mucor mucedo]